MTNHSFAQNLIQASMIFIHSFNRSDVLKAHEDLYKFGVLM